MHCNGRAFVRVTPDCGTQSCFPAKIGYAELHNQPSEQNKDGKLSCWRGLQPSRPEGL